MERKSALAELFFQPDRLVKLAEYLSRFNRKQSITILLDEDNIFNSSTDTINTVPVFANMIEALPIVFHQDWRKNRQGEIVLSRYKQTACLTSLIGYFGFNDVKMLLHLFVPYGQSQEFYGGQVLSKHARTRDMARNIYELVLLKNMAMELHPQIKIFISKN